MIIQEPMLEQLRQKTILMRLKKQKLLRFQRQRLHMPKTKKAKKISLKWAKISKVTGYNVRYATTKKKLKKLRLKT